MATFTLLQGFPKEFHPPHGSFPLRYADQAIAVAKSMGLDMTDLPIRLNTARAELIEVVRAGDTTELLHYRLQIGGRDVVVVVNPFFRWRVMNFLELDG